jgi:hypothetical protein
MLVARDGLSSPVTGTAAVVVVSTDGDPVALGSVDVASDVIGGTFVLGTLVDVCCPPQAVSNSASTANVDSNILNFLILSFSFQISFNIFRHILVKHIRFIGADNGGCAKAKLGVSLSVWGNSCNKDDCFLNGR